MLFFLSNFKDLNNRMHQQFSQNRKSLQKIKSCVPKNLANRPIYVVLLFSEAPHKSYFGGGNLHPPNCKLYLLKL